MLASAKKRVKGLEKILVDLSDSTYSCCICDHIDIRIVSVTKGHQNTKCLITTSCNTEMNVNF